MPFYWVTTRQQTYDHILCLENLIQAKRNRNDFSATVQVWEWFDNKWQKIDKEDMQEEWIK